MYITIKTKYFENIFYFNLNDYFLNQLEKSKLFKQPSVKF